MELESNDGADRGFCSCPYILTTSDSRKRVESLRFAATERLMTAYTMPSRIGPRLRDTAADPSPPRQNALRVMADGVRVAPKAKRSSSQAEQSGFEGRRALLILRSEIEPILSKRADFVSHPTCQGLVREFVPSAQLASTFLVGGWILA